MRPHDGWGRPRPRAARRAARSAATRVRRAQPRRHAPQTATERTENRDLCVGRRVVRRRPHDAPLQAARRSDAGERNARGRAVRAASAGRCRSAALCSAAPPRLSAAPPVSLPRAVVCGQRRGRRAAAAAAPASPRGAVSRRRVRGCGALASCARARRRQGQSQDAARRGILCAAGTARFFALQRGFGREIGRFSLCVSPIAGR
jgi:hypothetical protein